MPTEKWTALASRGNILSTELDSLADAAASTVNIEYDNASNLDRFGIAELQVTFGTNPTADAVVDLYCLPTLDGTNYPAGSADATPEASLYVGSFQVNASTSAQRLQTSRFELPPTKCKFVAVNRTGQSFPASGSTVALYTLNRSIG